MAFAADEELFIFKDDQKGWPKPAETRHTCACIQGCAKPMPWDTDDVGTRCFPCGSEENECFCLCVMCDAPTTVQATTETTTKGACCGNHPKEHYTPKADEVEKTLKNTMETNLKTVALPQTTLVMASAEKIGEDAVGQTSANELQHALGS